MAFFTYTYTFTNGSTADATQVNQNFSDVRNAVVDGTKDISVNNITVAGTSTLNGGVVLGNSSTPTVTWNASLNTSIPISTNTSFDFGSATLGLKSVYIGGTSTFTTRIMSAATATWTLTLPTTAGTGLFFLQTDGSGVTSWANISLPKGIQNLGLAASVATNALTIALKTAAGADPSSSSPVTLSFRNATSATGQYATVSQSAALSITVPSGATLGQTSAVSQYVWVYLINDAGTLDLAVSGVNVFDELSTQSSTQISSGATSGTVLYSGSAHSGAKSIRLIGRLLVSEATAGTWASAPSEISLNPVPSVTMSDWISDGTTTITAVTTNPTKGTTTNDQIRHRRFGSMMLINLSLLQTGAGAAGSGDYLFLVPNSQSIDTSVAPLYTGSTLQDAVTYYALTGNFDCSDGTNYIQGRAIPYDATHFRLAGVNTISNLRTMSSTNNPLSNAAQKFSGWIWLPVLGWSTYGP